MGNFHYRSILVNSGTIVQCQGRCSLLLPPRVSHEISWPQVRLHHVCQVLSSMKKSWITSWSSICLVNHIVLHFLWHFTLPGRFINQACACTVGFLRCWSLDGSEEITETWCSIGKTGLAQIDLRNNLWLWGYEELKQDQEGMLRRIADFTGFDLTEEEIQVAVHFSGHLDEWTSYLTMTILRDWTSTWNLTTTRSPAHWT